MTRCVDSVGFSLDRRVREKGGMATSDVCILYSLYKERQRLPTIFNPSLYHPYLSPSPFIENLTAMWFCKKTPSVRVKAMLLLFLIFLSTAETGAFARTMKPPTSGANTVYDPNSNRQVNHSGPSCTTYIPGGCGGRRRN
ncbi:hypothetical protein OIU78_006121 [Salix suchowensis]|nr:hypothetical protein OIU78_006121 [Salix suchowensis]